MDDSEAYLVYSESEDLWPPDGKIHFLGSWCLRYDRKDIWATRKFRVSENPWDDRKKLQDDYNLLKDIYEDVLAQLSKKLNEIHGTHHDVRFWRILVGWWLLEFIHITFHRWQVLEKAASEYEKPRMLVRSYGNSIPAPNDSHHFGFSGNPVSWNERLFADLATFFPNISVEELRDAAEFPSAGADGESPSAQEPKARPQKIREQRRSRLRRITVHLSDDFLGPLTRGRLELALGQIPWPAQTRPPKIWLPSRLENRQWQLEDKNASSYGRALGQLIPLHIPVSFVEGFQEWTNYSRTIFAGIHPEVIMTANAHYADDAWKLFAADKTANGARLVLQQHGGFYGTARIAPSQDYEVSISDRFLSWGWKEKAELKVHPAPAGRLLSVSNTPAMKRPSNLLLVLTSESPFPSSLYSSPIGSQFEGYLADQFEFLEGLSDVAQESLLVRDYPEADDFWGFRTRASAQKLNLCFNRRESKFSDSLRKSRLAVFTINSTTFLESFVANIPTVMFWNPLHSELSDRAKRHFKALQEAKVFFPDAGACAKHVNEIWGNEKEWWQSGEVQKAVKDFCQEFAYVGPKPIRELKAALTQW